MRATKRKRVCIEKRLVDANSRRLFGEKLFTFARCRGVFNWRFAPGRAADVRTPFVFVLVSPPIYQPLSDFAATGAASIASRRKEKEEEEQSFLRTWLRPHALSLLPVCPFNAKVNHGSYAHERSTQVSQSSTGRPAGRIINCRYYSEGKGGTHVHPKSPFLSRPAAKREGKLRRD